LTSASDRTAKGRVARLGSALVVALMIAMLAPLALPANAEVSAGQHMEVFYNRQLVLLDGYPANASVRVDVFAPNGDLKGTTTQTTDGTGFLEINHVGGAPDNDCWGSTPGTPNIRPGDKVQSTVIASGDIDFTIVRDVFINDASMEPTAGVDTSNDTITIRGHVLDVVDGDIAPGADVLELRLNKSNTANTWETGPGLDQDREGRKDLRVDIGADVQADGSFTRVLRVSHDDALDVAANGADRILEWSGAAANELTVFDASEGINPGCPPFSTPTDPPPPGGGDTTAPTVSLTAPAAGARLSGTVALSADASDNVGVARVVFLANGVQVDTDPEAPYRVPWDTTAGADGSYSLTARAVDTAGNATTSAAVSVTVDNTPAADTTAPTLTKPVANPTAFTIPGASTTITTSVNEAARVEFRIINRSGRVVRTLPDGSVGAGGGSASAVWNGRNNAGNLVRAGTYRAKVWAFDIAGNRSVNKISDGITVRR
jgi:hypothetical protein